MKPEEKAKRLERGITIIIHKYMDAIASEVIEKEAQK